MAAARRAAEITAALASIATIGWLDYETGPRWGFSLFYLIPIVFCGWRHGVASAVVASGAAAACWVVADSAWYRDMMPSVWNGVTRLVTYTAIGVMVARLRADQRRLNQLLAEQIRISGTDALTGLVNARAFYERAAQELARSRRTRAPLAMLYIDLDNFKRVNDLLGHARGDELLREVAAALVGCLRTSDVAARLGGDEFAVLLLDAQRDGAEASAGRLIRAVEGIAPRYPATGVGASVGVAWFATPPAEVERMVHAADGAMYRAKSAGKHRAVVDVADGN